MKQFLSKWVDKSKFMIDIAIKTVKFHRCGKLCRIRPSQKYDVQRLIRRDHFAIFHFI